MDFNFLGVCFISDDLPKRTHDRVGKKMEDLEQEVRDKFNDWLDKQGLEQVMGVIVKKGHQIDI